MGFSFMPKIKNTERGKAGEALAEAYLKEQGLTILDKNFRAKRAEIDLVATDNKELIIVEVKLRQNNRFGFPEEFVSTQKEKLLKLAGYTYKEINHIHMSLRFDVIAISIDEKEIIHYKDAF